MREESEASPKQKPVIWLASYPRSGNTLLRTVLHHCFALPSASVYPNDLGGNRELAADVGHIEHDADGTLHFPPGSLPLIKTHEPPRDQQPAIYVVRDGRAACVSLWAFYEKRLPLEAVISGQHRFGTWAAHVAAWHPWARPQTLLLKYEELLTDLPGSIAKIGQVLGRAASGTQIPARETIAGRDGRWVRRKSDWRAALNETQLALFDEVNGAMMRKLGYGPDAPPD